MEQYWMEVEHCRDGGALHRLATHEDRIAADPAARRPRVYDRREHDPLALCVSGHLCAESAAVRPLVYDRWQNDPLELFFSGHIYPKGAAVLQMVRRQLGDSSFWQAMHRYTTRHAYASVATADFERSLTEASGRDFSRFFRQRVYGAGLPAFQVSYAHDASGRHLNLIDRQVQPRDSLTGLFDADVLVEVLTDSGPATGTMVVRGELSELSIPLRS